MNRFVIILGLVLFCYLAKSNELLFNHITNEHGLTSSSVKAIYTDSYGYVWFGSEHGISRFDGVEVKSFNSFLPEGQRNIMNLSEDSTGNLWICTTKALFVWDRISPKFRTVPLSSNYVIDIYKIQVHTNNKLYVGTSQGFVTLDLISEKTKTLLLNDDSLHKANQIKDFIIDEEMIYMASMEGFVKYNTQSDSVNYIKNNRNISAGESGYLGIRKHDDNLYLIGLKRGLTCYSLNDGEFSSIGAFKSDRILWIEKFKNKLFIVKADYGLKVYDVNTNTIESIVAQKSDPTSISSNTVRTISIDSNNILWIGTNEAGVSYSHLASNTLKIYKGKNNQLLNQSVRSIYFDQYKNKLIGTRNGLYVIDSDENIMHYDQDDKNLRSRNILSFHEFKDTIIISTFGGGLSCYVPKTKQLKLWNDDVFNNQSIFSFTNDADGNLWAGSYNGLYRVSKANKIKNFNTSNSELQYLCIYSVITDSLNRLWAVGTGGIQVYDYQNDELKLIQSLNLGTNIHANYLFRDENERFWVGTKNEGVFVFNMDFELIEHFSEGDGLCNNAICSIIEGESNVFWITTLNGLSCYNLEKKEFTNYFLNYSTIGSRFCTGAALIDANKQIWLGNEDALIHFDYTKIAAQESKKNLLITDIYLEGKPLHEALINYVDTPVEKVVKLALPAKFNSIGFRFANLNFDKNKDNYRVKLEGKDTSWVLAHENKAFYTDLKPGKYVFKVSLAKSSKYELIKAEESIEVSILQVWYKKASTIILFSFVLLVGLIITVLLRIKRKGVVDIEPEKVNEKYESSLLNSDASKNLYSKLQKYMDDSKCYLQPDLSLKDLASAMDTTVHNISQVVNENANQRLTFFINTYRVNELKNKVKNPENKKYTLTALAKTCGFNSDSSFYRIFKNVTGQTPASYFSNSHTKKGNE